MARTIKRPLKKVRQSAAHEEWRHLKKSRLLIISVIVILFIPIMYGGFFLGSVWDPYGNTKHLPIAVVNNDVPTTLNGREIAVGSGLVDKLHDEHSMGWEFVSEETANEGLNDGKYYMKIVIPNDASKNVASITSETPSQTTIAYTTTPSRNFVASLLTKQAAETIAQSVSTEITSSYAKTILEQLGELKTGLADASNGASQLRDGSLQLQNGVSHYTAGVSQIHNGLSELSGALPTPSQITQLSDGVKNVQAGLARLNAAVSTPDPAMAAQQAKVQSDALALQTALVNYQTTASAAQASIGSLTTAINGGTPTVTVNSSDIAATLGVLSASQAVAQKSVTLLTELNTLTTMLTAQQSTLKTSVAQLNTGVTTLTPGLLGAVNGYTSIASANSKLLAGTTSLTESSPALNSGASQLSSGSATLASGLSDAASRLAVQPITDATAQQIAEPITTKHNEASNVPNYGYALSPYVLSLGLYVGALVFNVIYPVRRSYAQPKNARSWWWAKMSVAFVVAVGQAMVLDAIMVFGLGLHPDNPGKFVLLTMITSLTYMSIVSMLAILLDNIGRFLAMLLLVLQLWAAGGVFPIVLSAGFFQAINPLMPMTYSIYGFREAISSGLGTGVFWSNTLVLVAIALVVNFVIILSLRLHGMQRFQHEHIDD